MAIRGQRFQIDLDSDNDTDDPKPTTSAPQPSPFFGLVKDVKERTTPSQVTASTPPKAKSTETGFPTHRKRAGPSTFKQRRTHEASDRQRDAVKIATLQQAKGDHSSHNSNEPNTLSSLKDGLDHEVERQRIHEENKERLAQMSSEEIEEARQELMDGLSSSTIERLLMKAYIDDESTNPEHEPRKAQKVKEQIQNHKSAQKRVTFEEEEEHAPAIASEHPMFPSEPRDLDDLSQGSLAPHNDFHPPTIDPSSPNFLSELHDKYFPELPADPSKLSWMQPISEKSTYDSSAESLPAAALRFDFRGRLLPPRLSSQLPSTLGLHHHANAPSSAGYTVPELAHLARSSFPAQRCIAMQTLGRILYRLGRGDFGREGDDLCEGLWVEMEKACVIDNLVEVAGSDGEKGNISIWVTATEAVWLWRKGGGRRWKGR